MLEIEHLRVFFVLKNRQFKANCEAGNDKALIWQNLYSGSGKVVKMGRKLKEDAEIMETRVEMVEG